METAETGWEQDGLRDEIAAAYAPYVALCRLLEHRLREQPDDRPPVGWAAYLEALRALRDGTVAGDRTGLARLMADPAALPEPSSPSPDPITSAIETPHACLLDVPDPGRRQTTLRDLVERLAAAGRRILILAPDEQARAAVTETLAQIPGLLHTEAVPGEAGPPAGPTPPPGGPDATRRDVRVLDDPAPAQWPDDRPPLGGDPAPGAGPGQAVPGAERVVREAVLRPGGSAFATMWEAESRELRRGLLWVEQWPRDRATLAAVRAEAEEGRRLRAEREQRAADAVVAAAEALERARREAVAAQEDLERLGAELREAEEAAAGLRTELRDRQADADTAGQAAAAGTAAAETARGRLAALTEDQARCEHDLEAAGQRKAFLQEELPRARQALPEAAAEAARLMEATTAADADGHASYYRLAAAESALAAEKRQQNFAQRIRVAPATPETQDMRRQVAQRRRDADEAARRARQAREAYEKAEAYRTAVAEVIASGEQELITVREAQERLTADLARLAEEVAAADAEYQESARLAAAAVERADQTAAAAREAAALGHQADERATAAHTAHDAAQKAAEQAGAGVVAATRTLTDSESARERAHAEAEAAAERERSEIEAAEQAETGSGRHVAEFCAADPADLDDALLIAHRDRAMARIEELSADPSAELLLTQAAAVCATPLAVAACPALHDAAFDTLVATDAGHLTDGEFLLGAVRTHHWILLGDVRARPRPVDEEYTAHLLALAALARADAATAQEPGTTRPNPTPGVPPSPEDAAPGHGPESDPGSAAEAPDSGTWYPATGQSGAADDRHAGAPPASAERGDAADPGQEAAPSASGADEAAGTPQRGQGAIADSAQGSGVWYPAAGPGSSAPATGQAEPSAEDVRDDKPRGLSGNGRNNTMEFALPGRSAPQPVPAADASAAPEDAVPEATTQSGPGPDTSAEGTGGSTGPEPTGPGAVAASDGGTVPEPTLPVEPPVTPDAPEVVPAPPAPADVTLLDVPVRRESAAKRLEVAAGIVAARWAGGGEAGVLAEARRIRDAGLWEGRYRDAYSKVLRRLERDGDPDPEETLMSAAAGGRSLFARAAQAAPTLFHPAATRQD